MIMALFDKHSILRILSAYNPWWSSGTIHPALTKSYRRFAYYEAMQRMQAGSLRRTVILTGARRVGKTTIQYQMIDSLLKQKVPPQKILFVALDHPLLKLASFQDILDVYHETICPDKDVYYFFDEIQYAPDWDKWLKIIYDTQENTKTVVTGSASPVLYAGSSESGTGRFSLISVPTLSFYEYCALLNISLPDLPADLRPSSFKSMSQQERGQVMMKLSGLQNHLTRYMMLGGFPELALAKSDVLAQQILREDVVDKVLKRDLPSLYGIRNPLELERIFLYLCKLSSDIVSIDAIARELQGVTRPTVERYIAYMESANLIYISLPIEMQGKKVLKARPKIYVADTAIRNAVLMHDDVLTDPEELGRMVETTVFRHVSSFYYQKATQVGYFRGGERMKEVDVVVDLPNARKVLIEVKFREQAPIADDDAICLLAEEASHAFVITKRFDDYGTHHTPSGKELIRLPAFAFMYLLGHAEKNEREGMV